MEAVARQLATGRRCLVVRNGLFSYRWSQIFEAGSVSSETTVCSARPASDERHAPWIPPRSTRWSRPSSASVPRSSSRHMSRRRQAWCCPMTTSARRRGGARGRRALRPRLHRVGALWVDMTDARCRRPAQRPAEGMERLTVRGLRDARRGALAARVMATTSTSFAVDLQKWLTITEAYTRGRRRTTRRCRPTRSRTTPRLMLETRAAGLRRAASRLRSRSARESAPCSRSAGSRPSRPTGSRHPASWWPTRTTPRSAAARSSSSVASRWPPACR